MVGRFPEKYGRWMSPAFFFQPLLLLEKSLDPQSSHIVTKNVHLELQALCADVLILIFNMLIYPDLPNLHHVEQKATKNAQAHS